MKTTARTFFAALALLAGLAGPVNAAVTFTITPSAISNTYNGSIILQVSNLIAGDTVVVQKYLDTDTNGIIDPGDYLVQQFNLTDGQAGMVIGGVTNINVPGDTDGAANGQITAKLNFPDRNFIQSIIGKYIFVLSSPVGHFSPITNLFTVTNFPFAQKFTGNVVSNATPVPNALVFLFPPPNGHEIGTPVAGTVANNSGAYTIQVPPGTYVPLAIKSNYVVNYSTSPVLTLGSGQTINTNLTVTNSTAGISGRVVDANNSSIGLPGLFLPATGTNGAGNHLIAIGFTDASGNFNLRVGSGSWSISGDVSGSLNVLGYVGYDNNTNVNAGATGVNLPVFKATAMFYGTVKDGLGTPLNGVAIFSSDNNGIYGNDGMSDINGNYVATAIGGLSGDQWQVQKDFGGPASYIYSQGQGGITLSSGQAYQYNFTGIPATNHITGYVQFNGSPVSGVGVNANATISGIGYQPGTAHTDTNGNYTLNVANGDWSVSVNCNGGSDSLDNILGGGNYQCPNSQDVIINDGDGTADFPLFPPNSGQIVGHVTDAYGDAIVGVSVYASDGVGDNYSTTTDSNGNYSLTVVDGTYNVSVDCGQLNSRNYNCVSNDSVSVADDSVEADFNAQFATTPTYPFTTLHGFSAAATNASSFLTNSDGAGPSGGLVISGSTLYGTAGFAGTNGAGTVFAVGTNLTNFTVVHTFAALDAATGTTNSDGSNPNAMVLSGNILYGVADTGGTNGNGTIFAVNTNGAGFRVMHTFMALDSATGTTNSDGAGPSGGLVISGSSLYGTAGFGGTNGSGTVFAVSTNLTNFTVVYTFTALDAATGPTNSDGAGPSGGLVISGSTLYGTTAGGGSSGGGTIFAVGTNGTGFTVLHSFTGGNDGANPIGGFILSSNTLYGTASGGGTSGNGTVFAVTTNSTNFTVLHRFTGGDDGANPNGGLILSGNTLYGTASGGGTSGNGTVFAVTANGTNFTVLHSFTGGDDGANPNGGLILSGNTLYGTASGGGSAASGTVFALSISPLPPAPTLSPPAHFANGQFQMLLNGVANQNYTLQMSTNLSSTNWTVLLITNNPATNSFLLTDPNATNKQRFYRILVGP
jgi:uncharacterized repeat protein (TIGR03803 family)